MPFFMPLIVALSLSLDAFAVAFAYGCKKIYIPTSSALIINFICTGFTAISFLFGAVLINFIPVEMAIYLSFTVLMIIGLTKLMDSITKSIIRKHTDISKELKLTAFNFKFILHLYADPEAADVDISKSISSKEADLHHEG